MTEFEMRIETERSSYSSNHEYGTAELELHFDEKSAKAFHQWIADGCKGSLAISEKGCEYCPIPLVINANPTEEDIEKIKKMADDTSFVPIPLWRNPTLNTYPATGDSPSTYGPHITCQQPPGTAIQMTSYPTKATDTYHLEKTEDSETKGEK